MLECYGGTGNGPDVSPISLEGLDDDDDGRADDGREREEDEDDDRDDMDEDGRDDMDDDNDDDDDDDDDNTAVNEDDKETKAAAGTEADKATAEQSQSQRQSSSSSSSSSSPSSSRDPANDNNNADSSYDLSVSDPSSLANVMEVEQEATLADESFVIERSSSSYHDHDDDGSSSKTAGSCFGTAAAKTVVLKKNLCVAFEVLADSPNRRRDEKAKADAAKALTMPQQHRADSSVVGDRPGAAAASKKLEVYLRVRPTSNPLEQSSVKVVDRTTVRTVPPKTSFAGRLGDRAGPNSSSNSNYNGSSADDAISLTSEGDSSAPPPAANQQQVKEFSYSGVFGEDSVQQEVYEATTAPLVEGLFGDGGGNAGDQQHDGVSSSSSSSDGGASNGLGRSALLFAYGVTNAGKTHTIMGGASTLASQGLDPRGIESNNDAGILPRGLAHIFKRMEEENEKDRIRGTGRRRELFMSYLEIYNENVYDLLSPQTAAVALSAATTGDKKSAVLSAPAAAAQGKKVPLKLQDRGGLISVKDLSHHALTSVSHGLYLALMASKQRSVSGTNLNEGSSRSHSVCQLEVVTISKAESESLERNRTAAFAANPNHAAAAKPFKKGAGPPLRWRRSPSTSHPRRRPSSGSSTSPAPSERSAQGPRAPSRRRRAVSTRA